MADQDSDDVDLDLYEGEMLGLIGVSGAGVGAPVGVARCLTDYAWCCYLSDLAVARAAQGQGNGQRLLDEVRRHLGPQVALILSSVPDAVAFYERAGMERIAEAFWYRRER